MDDATVKHIDAGPGDDEAPPPGTAIVRPLRHVRAVRERHLHQLAERSPLGESRSARAWAWALGETEVAPVTDRATGMPPSQAEIDAEIAEADERRLRSDQENRADGAATVLRWLIGQDDCVPVRGENRGELVDGFGDIVRSRDQIAALIAAAVEAQQRAAVDAAIVGPRDRLLVHQDAAYLDGVIATLTWVLGERPNAPITGTRSSPLTTRDLKRERVHAEDIIDQATRLLMADNLPPPSYGHAVELAITWLLGGTIPHYSPTRSVTRGSSRSESCLAMPPWRPPN